MQAETRFKINVMARLKKLHPQVWYTKIQQVAKRGDPDLLLCAGGRLIAWELKVSGNKATVLQQHTLDAITNAGGIARVVTPDNIGEAMEELKWIILKAVITKPTTSLEPLPQRESLSSGSS